MDKKYLLAPGPTPIPPEVLLAMAEPIIHHRAPVFSTLFEEVKKGLKYVFQTKNDVLIFAASGTGGMEGAIINTLSKGDKAIVVRGGKFGERWGQLCQVYGVEPVFVDVEWGRSVNPEIIFFFGRLIDADIFQHFAIPAFLLVNDPNPKIEIFLYTFTDFPHPDCY